MGKAEAAELLPGFRIAATGRLAPVAAWGREHGGGDPLEDCDLEVTSRLAIRPATDLA